MRDSGRRTDVAAALDRSLSRVSHEATKQVNPVLRDALGMLLGLIDGEGCSPYAFAEVVSEIIELRDITEAETDTLIVRGLRLLEWENQIGLTEDLASLTGHGHADALRRVAMASNELAAILDELELRGVDLHELFRAQAVAS